MLGHYDCLSNYELTHVIDHLAAVGRIDAVTKLLTDEEFLERKIHLQMEADLSAEMALALDLSGVKSDPDSILQFSCRAYLLNQSFIRRHPETLFQSMWNVLHWRGNPDANGFFEAGAHAGRERSSTVAEGIANWMARWRRKKEDDSRFRWVRHVRPLPSDRGAAMQREFRGHGHVVFSVRFSPDGLKIASGSATKPSGGEASELDGARVIVWDATSGATLTEMMQEDSVNAVAFSPSGLHLAAAIAGGTLKVLDVATSRVLLQVKLPDRRGARSIVFSPDGRFILCGCYDNCARVVDASSGRVGLELADHPGIVVEALFAGNSGRIVTGCSDGVLRVWDATSGHCTLTMQGVGGPVSALAISPDGTRLASSFGDDDFTGRRRSGAEVNFDIQIFDLVTGKSVGCLSGHPELVRCIAISPDGRSLASAGGSFVGGDRTIRLWDIASLGEITQLPGHATAATSVAFSPDGKRLLSAAWDATVRLWELDAPIEMPRLLKHEGDVFGMTFSPDGRYIASSSFDETRILIWRSADGGGHRKLEGHESLIRCFQFSEDSSMLISGSGSKYHGEDCSARIWDIESGLELMALRADKPEGPELHGHVNPIKIAGFSPDGRHAITGHADLMSFTQEVNFIRVWDLETGEQIDCFGGDSERAHLLIAQGSNNLRALAIEKFTDSEAEVAGLGPMGSINLRSVAGWTAPSSAAVMTYPTETAIVLEDGSRLWLAETMGQVLCASPVGPVWAVGSANDVMIFCVAGREAEKLFAHVPRATGNRATSHSPVRSPAGRQLRSIEELFAAIDDGHLTAVSQFIRKNPGFRNVKDRDGDTLLHRIAKRPFDDRVELAKMLLELGADPNAPDADGATPLHWVAARPWGMWFAVLLLEYGADPNAEANSGGSALDTASRMSGMLGGAMFELLRDHVDRDPAPAATSNAVGADQPVQQSKTKRSSWLGRILGNRRSKL